jgi:D-3-phosphoglycerate dehydrogenase
MGQFKILHTGAPADDPLDLERQGLDSLDVEIIQPGRLRSEDEIIEHGRDADILLVIAEPITRRVISSLPRLKGVIRYGIGVDTVDLKAATEFGVVVANFPDFCLDEVANHTMALLLALNRRLFRLDRVVRDGQWSPAVLRSVLPGIGSLQGETLGLVAFGNIPRRVAPRAQAFGLKVIAYDPYLDDEVFGRFGVRRVQRVEELLAESDYVSSHLPLTEETYHFFTAERFRLMKPTAYFINTSRGKVVDQPALIRALQEGWIAGAGLDVFEDEPLPADSPLTRLENVILTPHAAYYSDRSERNLKLRVGRAAADILRGFEPEHVANPDVLNKLNLKPREA